MGNPSPIPEWGAGLISKLKKEGVTRAEIAHIVGYSTATVRDVLRYEKKHKRARVPQMGKGKLKDERWIFAGPKGFDALAELEMLKERLEDDELLTDVHSAFVNQGAYSPAYSTLCNALGQQLHYTRKRVRR